MTNFRLYVAAAALALFAIQPAAASAKDETSLGPACDGVAATDGSDQNQGTVSSPYRTVEKLSASLLPGQRGCLRSGTYVAPMHGSEQRFDLRSPGTRLTSHPGESATLRGRIVVWPSAAGSVLEGLSLDGRSDPPPDLSTDPPVSPLPSPTINAPDVALRSNDITNHHTGVCVLPTSFGGGVPDRVRIEYNRIHACGWVSPSRGALGHGIYVASGTGGLIRGNVIYDNSARGIQLYPNANHMSITNNTLDSNGEALNLGGEGDLASSYNTFEDNIVTNSKRRWNIESGWTGRIGVENLVRQNCLLASNANAYFNTNGGIVTPTTGFEARDNLVADPLYVDRPANDFRLRSGSPCAGKGAPPPQPGLIDIDPDSPANNNSPRVKGTAAAGSIVRLYTSSGCAGAAAVQGSASGFASPGLPVSVPDDSTTTFWATATDEAGSASACSLTSLTYTEDSSPPQTTVDSGPPAVTNDATPTFGFSSSEAGSTFQCRVDAAAFGPCSSPHPTASLGDGPHTFEVRATDPAGNIDPTPADRTFTIDTGSHPPPGPNSTPPPPTHRTPRSTVRPRKCSKHKGKKRAKCIKKRCGRLKGRKKKTCVKKARRSADIGFARHPSQKCRAPAAWGALRRQSWPLPTATRARCGTR